MRRKKGGEAKPGHEKARQNRTKKKSRGRKGKTEGPMESMNENREGT